MSRKTKKVLLVIGLVGFVAYPLVMNLLPPVWPHWGWGYCVWCILVGFGIQGSDQEILQTEKGRQRQISNYRMGLYFFSGLVIVANLFCLFGALNDLRPDTKLWPEYASLFVVLNGIGGGILFWIFRMLRSIRQNAAEKEVEE